MKRGVPEGNLSAIPDLELFSRLRDVQLRTTMESERGFYIAEGEKVIRRALQARHRPYSFLLTPKWFQQLADVIPDGAPCHVMDETEIEALTGFHVHRGALAAMHRPEPISAADVLAVATRVVVAEDLVDHTNLGALFRCAAALGFDAVLMSPRCVDPFYRRSIKVAMGAVFALPHARFDDWYASPSILSTAGFTSYAMTLDPDAVDLGSVEEVPDRVALVVGSEGHGISDHWQREADVRVRIPMAAGIDSLNVAVAAAIGCWHLAGRTVQSSSVREGETGQSSG